MMPTTARAEAADRTTLRAATAVAVALVLFRSALFVIHGQVSFDSDQAVIGLMGKHLAEGRAFPLFLYGQSYILAIEPWLAAPLFLIGGASMAALKLPLLAINVAIAVIMVRLLHEHAGLRPAHALVASLFFVLPSPGASSSLMEAIGGNVEPLLYILLLWILRDRPAWFGVVAGIGFLQREFTAYGVLGVAIIELAHGELLTRDGARRWFARLRVAVVVWLFVQWIRPLSSPAGPGTTVRDLFVAQSNFGEILGRFCFDPKAIGLGLWRLATSHWADLFGAAPIPLAWWGMYSRKSQGLAYSGLAPAATMAIVVARIAMLTWKTRRANPPSQRHSFCAYLVVVAALSALLYSLGRCGNLSVFTIRYDLLSLAGACGLVGWYLGVETNRGMRRTVAAVVIAWTVLMAGYHVVLWSEWVPRAPVTEKDRIVRALEARGVKYVIADYWLAYYIDFATRERVVAASEGLMRIPAYDHVIGEHRAETVVISRTSCGPGTEVIPGVYFCRP